MRIAFTFCAVMAMAGGSALAQPGGPGGPGGGRSFQMPNPIFDALDADKDGVISAAEMQNAAAALKPLDKDGDGKISREEVRPQFPSRGDGGGPGGPGGGPGGGFSVEGVIARTMEADTNKDGKLSKDELTALGERGTRILDTADANKDGAVDSDELKKYAEGIMERFRGSGRREGGRPSGNRPQRPQSDGDNDRI